MCGGGSREAMDGHHGRPSMIPLRAFEKRLLDAGYVFERSRGSHHFYRAPSGRRMHLSAHKEVGPQQQREILRQLDEERRQQQERERQERERQRERQGGRKHAG